MKKSQKEDSPPKTPARQQNTGIHKLLDETVKATYDDIITIMEAKIELVKIELTEKLSLAAASVILGVILILGISYFVTTLALLTGELLGHPFLGYLIISLVFLSGFLFFTKLKPLLLKNLIQNILLSLHDYKK